MSSRTLRARIDAYISEVNADHDPEELYIAGNVGRLWADSVLRWRYDDRGNIVFFREFLKHNVLSEIMRPRLVLQMDKKRIITESALPDGAATEATLLLLKTQADLLATEATLTALSAKFPTAVVYVSTGSVSLNANGNLKAADATHKIRIHAIWGQATAAVEGNIQDGSGGSNLLHFKFNDREGFVLSPAAYPMFWGINAAVNTALYVTFTTAAQCYFTMIYSLE